MTSGPVADLLDKRTRQAVATILSAKERFADPHIDEESSRRFRKVVMREVNELGSLAAAMLDESGEVNAFWLDELARLYGSAGRV